MAHRDTFAVEAEHEQVIGLLGFAQPIAIERVEILRSMHRQFFDLPFRHRRAPVRFAINSTTSSNDDFALSLGDDLFSWVGGTVTG